MLQTSMTGIGHRVVKSPTARSEITGHELVETPGDAWIAPPPKSPVNAEEKTMPRFNQHNRIDSTERCVWSSIDVGFYYGHTRCPNDCQNSTIIEDQIGDSLTEMVTVTWTTTTVETHTTQLPATAYQVATDLLPAGAGEAVPAALDRLLARHENIHTAQEDPLEQTRHDLRRTD